MEAVVLARALGMTVLDFRCRACVHRFGAEEPTLTHQLVLVRRGVFQRLAGAEAIVADAHHVLFYNAGESYRYAHPLAGGDDCTVIDIPEELARELVAGADPRHAEKVSAPFRFGHEVGSRAVLRLHYELLARLRQESTALAIEDVLAQLATAAIAGAYSQRGLGTVSPRTSSRVLRSRRELCEEIKLMLNARVEAPPSLAELAATFAASPFHLSRTFAGAVGISLRRYLAGLRARLAAERLAAGTADLTGLALDLGFGDHSHFTHAFRAEWDVPPSAFRARFRQ
jgi:AraC-like DNA-binding protein